MSNQQPLRRLLDYNRQHRRELLLASFYSIANRALDLMPPVLIGVAVDVVVSQEDSFLGRFGLQDPVQQLAALAALTVVIWSFESLFQYLYGVEWRNLAQTVQHEMRQDAYDHVQGLDMAYFEEKSTGELIAVLNNDINQLERFLDHGANDILQLATSVVVILSMFLIIIPEVAWLAILPMPIVIYGTLRYQRRLAPLYLAVREKAGLLNGQLANNISGIATIKSFTTEKYEAQRVQALSDDYRVSNEGAIRLSAGFIPLIRMIIVGGFVAIMFFGGVMVLNGQLNVGAYSVLVFMTQRLLWPLTRLGETLDLYQRAMASTTRVLDLLQVKAHIISGRDPLPVDKVRGAVSFDAVQFAYSDGEPPAGYKGLPRRAAVVHDLSLTAQPGETIAIVGATGSGKSTLVKLLLRFYDVESGRVCLDGHDVRDLRLGDLRRAIGFVSQDVFLFHGTVRENIAYGALEASMDQIMAAARTAEAHDFITQLPYGYDTIVGERGQRLSGGQRQRLSIARAVLKNPPVLILDEATSAVDNETEAAIQRSLERIIVGRTTIVIAHRLSTVRHADCIFVLDNGVLSEQGRHEELIAANGIYAALWDVQTGEHALG